MTAPVAGADLPRLVVSMADLDALCRDVGPTGAVWLNPLTGKVVVRRGAGLALEASEDEP